MCNVQWQQCKEVVKRTNVLRLTDKVGELVGRLVGRLVGVACLVVVVLPS
jgi:hypothetical protein